jgi:Flp pilus assembly protein CpaB
MKRLVGLFVAVLVCGLASVIGLTIATAASPIGLSSDYDMPPEQTQKFIAAAALKLGGKATGADSYQVPVLPWSSTTLKATVTPKGSGSHIEFNGHATKLKELKKLLDEKFPPLTAP